MSMIMHQRIFLTVFNPLNKASHDYNYSTDKMHFIHFIFFEESNFCKQIV